MNKIIRGLDTILSIFGKLLEATLAVGVIVSVIMRYVFSISFVWSEEMLTMVFVATTFFGAALGIRESEHITITNFVDSMPLKVKRFFKILSQLVIITVSIGMIYYSIRIIHKVGRVPSPATGIHKGIYYSILPITFFITIFYSLVSIVSEFFPIEKPRKGYKDDFELGDEIVQGGK
ncbi:TRAP-type C4-dicarboxylate transport system, small permease component [Sphaerochaeta pleomorpha str. Grapes]|uniref:TRAP-type C4-dicarboxylate transport system, small permease component n=1 Tax=Sphaerochaeta pleomorpha (strain ATCC BAA-1885 / DSM 22778 / Grapes) TaxID=158190 RepID=G8QX98_SPHPG|nr:TRAP transporter small permease [Sphaerochaeta pleomorpha]AEV28399.1 TRAP-type C4-dicarboxylate transport system, small permease component [Sphaerochaeta pleomorpha str. Grapes]